MILYTTEKEYASFIKTTGPVLMRYYEEKITEIEDSLSKSVSKMNYYGFNSKKIEKIGAEYRELKENYRTMQRISAMDKKEILAELKDPQKSTPIIKAVEVIKTVPFTFQTPGEHLDQYMTAIIENFDDKKETVQTILSKIRAVA